MSKKNILKYFNMAEWIILAVSLIAITAGFFACGNTQYHYLIGSIIGVVSIMFVAKGNPIGQILVIVFSVFYGIISYSYKYYGEMITYLGMSLPIAIVALVSWLRHPFNGNKGEVKVNSLSKKEWIIFAVASAAVTVGFFFILRALDTANLWVSTLSVLTSFAAAYLTMRRSRFYAIGYALNDVVLIVLWAMASVSDISYLSMTICFCAFFIVDMYGFINWTAITRRQRKAEKDERTQSAIDQNKTPPCVPSGEVPDNVEDNGTDSK